MKIVIAGGHGQIALRLARLLGTHDEVKGLIRNPDHADDVRAMGAEPVLCDLESAAPDEVAAAVEGADAVVFAAGAGPGSGEPRKETMDFEGAVKLIEAAKAKGVPRYVMISSMGADPDAQGDGFAAYLRAKGRADAALVESGLDYTIVRPGRLTDEWGTGRVEIGISVGRSEIPRDDVAAVLAAVLARVDMGGRVFELVSGSESIDAALSAFIAEDDGT
jgi:uncharacterized protein YbjT (DUF2867 family)